MSYYNKKLLGMCIANPPNLREINDYIAKKSCRLYRIIITIFISGNVAVLKEVGKTKDYDVSEECGGKPYYLLRIAFSRSTVEICEFLLDHPSFEINQNFGEIISPLVNELIRDNKYDLLNLLDKRGYLKYFRPNVDFVTYLRQSKNLSIFNLIDNNPNLWNLNMVLRYCTTDFIYLILYSRPHLLTCEGTVSPATWDCITRISKEKLFTKIIFIIKPQKFKLRKADINNFSRYGSVLYMLNVLNNKGFAFSKKTIYGMVRMFINDSNFRCIDFIVKNNLVNHHFKNIPIHIAMNSLKSETFTRILIKLNEDRLKMVIDDIAKHYRFAMPNTGFAKLMFNVVLEEYHDRLVSDYSIKDLHSIADQLFNVNEDGILFMTFVKNLGLTNFPHLINKRHNYDTIKYVFEGIVNSQTNVTINYFEIIANSKDVQTLEYLCKVVSLSKFVDRRMNNVDIYNVINCLANNYKAAYVEDFIRYLTSSRHFDLYHLTTLNPDMNKPHFKIAIRSYFGILDKQLISKNDEICLVNYNITKLYTKNISCAKWKRFMMKLFHPY